MMEVEVEAKGFTEVMNTINALTLPGHANTMYNLPASDTQVAVVGE